MACCRKKVVSFIVSRFSAPVNRYGDGVTRAKKLNPNETYTVYKVDVPDEALTGEDEDILNYDDLDDPDAFV